MGISFLAAVLYPFGTGAWAAGVACAGILSAVNEVFNM